MSGILPRALLNASTSVRPSLGRPVTCGLRNVRAFSTCSKDTGNDRHPCKAPQGDPSPHVPSPSSFFSDVSPASSFPETVCHPKTYHEKKLLTTIKDNHIAEAQTLKTSARDYFRNGSKESNLNKTNPIQPLVLGDADAQSQLRENGRKPTDGFSSLNSTEQEYIDSNAVKFVSDIHSWKKNFSDDVINITGGPQKPTARGSKEESISDGLDITFREDASLPHMNVLTSPVETVRVTVDAGGSAIEHLCPLTTVEEDYGRELWKDYVDVKSYSVNMSAACGELDTKPRWKEAISEEAEFEEDTVNSSVNEIGSDKKQALALEESLGELYSPDLADQRAKLQLARENLHDVFQEIELTQHSLSDQLAADIHAEVAGEDAQLLQLDSQLEQGEDTGEMLAAAGEEGLEDAAESLASDEQVMSNMASDTSGSEFGVSVASEMTHGEEECLNDDVINSCVSTPENKQGDIRKLVMMSFARPYHDSPSRERGSQQFHGDKIMSSYIGAWHDGNIFHPPSADEEILSAEFQSLLSHNAALGGQEAAVELDREDLDGKDEMLNDGDDRVYLDIEGNILSSHAEEAEEAEDEYEAMSSDSIDNDDDIDIHVHTDEESLADDSASPKTVAVASGRPGLVSMINLAYGGPAMKSLQNSSVQPATSATSKDNTSRLASTIDTIKNWARGKPTQVKNSEFDHLFTPQEQSNVAMRAEVLLRKPLTWLQGSPLEYPAGMKSIPAFVQESNEKIVSRLNCAKDATASTFSSMTQSTADSRPVQAVAQLVRFIQWNSKPMSSIDPSACLSSQLESQVRRFEVPMSPFRMISSSIKGGKKIKSSTKCGSGVIKGKSALPDPEYSNCDGSSQGSSNNSGNGAIAFMKWTMFGALSTAMVCWLMCNFPCAEYETDNEGEGEEESKKGQ